MKCAIILAAILIVAISGGIIFGLGKHFVSIRGQHLERYHYSSGGGMPGGYYSMTVKRTDDGRAYICSEQADWHSQDPTISEYIVDASILDELESVVRKYKMNFWNRKTFSRMLILDGESSGHSFQFDDGDIDFSSQHYPMKYREKLQKLDDVITTYLQNAEPLPGLVNPNREEPESFSLTENELKLYVCAYRENTLEVRILNGCEEDTVLPYTYRLTDMDTAELIAAQDDDDTMTIYPGSWDEMNIRLEERLDAGHYQLTLGEHVIPFEIR